MKISLSLLLFCYGLASFAAPINCLDAVEPVITHITHNLAKETREVVLYNLSVYEDWAKEAQSNAYHGFSNHSLSLQIEKSLADHASDKILMIPVGKIITSCVKSNLNFNGTRSEQIATARAAIKRIQKIRKAIN